MELMLYHGEGSNCCQRLKWILRYKKIAYQEIDCSEMPATEYGKINPFLLAPTLVVDGVPVLESLVQAELIEELFSQYSLKPETRSGQIRVREICQVVAATIHPSQTNRVAKLAFPDGSPDQLRAYRRDRLSEGLDRLQPLLGTGNFCFGEAFSLADIFVLPIYLKAKALGVSPKLRFERLLSVCQSEPQISLSAPADLIGFQMKETP